MASRSALPLSLSLTERLPSPSPRQAGRLTLTLTLTPHRPLGKLGDVTFWGPRDRLRCLRAGKEAEGQ